MTDAEIYAQLTPIFRDVFDDDALELRPDMSADDVDDWDSLSHIRLVLTVEKHFKRKFSAAKVSALKNVGEFVELIKSTA